MSFAPKPFTAWLSAIFDRSFSDEKNRKNQYDLLPSKHRKGSFFAHWRNPPHAVDCSDSRRVVLLRHGEKSGKLGISFLLKGLFQLGIDRHLPKYQLLP